MRFLNNLKNKKTSQDYSNTIGKMSLSHFVFKFYNLNNEGKTQEYKALFNIGKVPTALRK